MNTLYEFSGYRVVECLPTVSEYLGIVKQVYPTANYNDVVINKALENSLYGVVVESSTQIVGMGRIVGDNATIFIIQDVLIMPGLRGKGIETAIIDALLIYLENHAPDQSVVISLPSINAMPFYADIGFKSTAPNVFGMFRKIDRLNPERQQIPWK